MTCKCTHNALCRACRGVRELQAIARNLETVNADYARELLAIAAKMEAELKK